MVFRYMSSFHVKAFGKVDVIQTQSQILDLLRNGYSNDSITIKVPNNEVSVLHIGIVMSFIFIFNTYFFTFI